MEINVTAIFLSSATSVIIGALVGVLTQHIKKLKGFELIPNDRRKKLEGDWLGTVSQIDQDPYQVSMHLSVRQKQVKGTGILQGKGEDQEPLSMIFQGGFSKDQFLKLEYRNKDNQTVQFGTLILTLSGRNSCLEGQFLGYGPITEKLVHGELRLEKVKNI
jgi:hypothetical protein